MSLDWNAKAVAEEFKSHPLDDERWHPVLEAMVWNLLACDIGTITEKNVDELWYRTRFWQALHGAELRFTDGTEIRLTRQDIVNLIGLRTNVITLSRASWIKKFMDYNGDKMYRKPDEKSAAVQYLERITKD